jgi:hypothetical protein
MSEIKRASWKDVTFAYTVEEGLSSVQALNASPAVLRTAMQKLDENNVPFKDLEAWCREQGIHYRRRSRAPQAGETRKYSSQQIKEGHAPFLKIPLNVLGIEKSKVTTEVEFTSEKITIFRPTSLEPS